MDPLLEDQEIPQPVEDTQLPQPAVVTVQYAQYCRKMAYINESDPLFFKSQRGEATTENWLAKVEEIKLRFPYPTQS